MTATDTQKNTVSPTRPRFDEARIRRNRFQHAYQQLLPQVVQLPACRSPSGVHSCKADAGALHGRAVRHCPGTAFCAHLPFGRSRKGSHALLAGIATGATAVLQAFSSNALLQELRDCCILPLPLISFAPQVSRAKVHVEQKPWNRVNVDGMPHNHGYSINGTETRTADVEYSKSGELQVTAGIKELQVLKTTQSGYVGYLKVRNMTNSCALHTSGYRDTCMHAHGIE
eukprot:353273-Chlamydomonas_euryale.AAC.23